MVGNGGKAAAGGYQEVVITEAHYVLPVTGTDEGMNDVMDEMTMPCLERTSVHLM